MAKRILRISILFAVQGVRTNLIQSITQPDNVLVARWDAPQCVCSVQ